MASELLDQFHSVSDYLVTLAQFPASLFTELSGGNHSTPNTKIHSGGGRLVVVEGPSTIEDVVLVKPLERVVDKPLLAFLALYHQGFRSRVAVNKVHVNSARAPVGIAELYGSAAIAGVEYPQVSIGGADVAMIRLTLSPEQKL